jgi:hypothetical protein
MTTAQCATNLLLHFAPEERSIPDSGTYPGRNAAVLEALNGALQECFGNASPWVRWDERGALLQTPTEITLDVTAGSTAATITGWQPWMSGCTVVIAGHDVDNQIRNGSASAVLKYPYGGTTGTAGGTVYQDSIPIPADVLSVHGPVRVNGMDIHPRPSADVFSTRHTDDYGSHIDFVEVPVTRPRVGAAAGRPLSYWLETWSAGNTAAPALRLRLGPANNLSGVLEYRCMLKPPVLTNIASTDSLPIPFEFVQTVFLPIARQKLTACPFFRDQSGITEINRAYQEAIRLLEKLKPSKDDGIQFIARF